MGRKKVAVRALEQWVTGRGTEGVRLFYVEHESCVDTVLSELTADDMAFVPAGVELPAATGRVIEYDGALSVPGDQLFLEGQIVEVQDYLASGFVEVVGPTVVHLGGEDGWSALIEDAASAQQLGVFPEHLLNPSILLGDRHALLDLTAKATARRFHLWANRSVTCGSQGRRLGESFNTAIFATPPTQGAEAISGVVSPTALETSTPHFASVGRFVAALDLLRALRVSAKDFPLVGFGLSLIEDDMGDAVPTGPEPILGCKGDEYLLINMNNRARHRLSRDTAMLVEVLQSSSSLELAIERARKQFSLSDDQAQATFQQLGRDLRVGPALFRTVV